MPGEDSIIPTSSWLRWLGRWALLLSTGIFLGGLGGKQLHRFGDSHFSGFGLFRFGDPFQIFSLVRRGAAGEEFGEFRARQRLNKIFREVSHG